MIKIINNFLITILFFLVSISFAKAQQSNTASKSNFLKENSFRRIHLGKYNSYTGDKIGLLTAGFDYGIKLIKIKPDYNLIDFSLGTNLILGFDQKIDSSRSRPNRTRVVPGFELNWNIRIFFLKIKLIKTRLFIEGMGTNFVYFTKPYPDNGTNINMGSHIGIGLENQINDKLKAFKCLRLYHISNGKSFKENPTLNAIGLVVGLQF